MREILFRGKTVNTERWAYGYFSYNFGNDAPQIREKTNCCSVIVAPETVGQYTGLTDKNGTKIFEGDIVQYNTYDDFDCQAVVKIGDYNQDGSGGEYAATRCLGIYCEVDNITCPDWCENEPDYFGWDYRTTINLLQAANRCEVIGNVYDNSELIKE